MSQIASRCDRWFMSYMSICMKSFGVGGARYKSGRCPLYPIELLTGPVTCQIFPLKLTRCRPWVPRTPIPLVNSNNNLNLRCLTQPNEAGVGQESTPTLRQDA